MLKAHQACIDLEKNVLRIRGREVPFLPEHEIPNSDLHESGELDEPQMDTGSPTNRDLGSTQQASFPGHGQTLGSATENHPQNLDSRPKFPESHISNLMDLGATREQAERFLQAAGGNLDMAAAMLF